MKKRKNRFLNIACALLCLSVAGAAIAEKADRDKPINLEADTVEMNDVTHISTYQGNVKLTQGTLLIRGDRLLVLQDAAGELQHATTYGNPASFRQKREGLDEYVDGYALRIEYDATADKVELFSQAHMKRNQDDVKGNYISYDSKTEFYQVVGGKEAASDRNPKGRVRAVIQPKPKTKTQPAAPRAE